MDWRYCTASTPQPCVQSMFSLGVQGERKGPAHAHDGDVRPEVQDGLQAAAARPRGTAPADTTAP